MSDIVYVLVRHGYPIAVAERLERLNEEMARYTAAEQAQMRWVEVQVLD